MMPAALETASPGRRTERSTPDTAAASTGRAVMGLDPLPELDPSLNPVIARAYSATTRGAAAMLFSREAPALSKLGYVPASERWEESHYAPARAIDSENAGGTLWVTYLAKSITLPPRVCSFCGSELPG